MEAPKCIIYSVGFQRIISSEINDGWGVEQNLNRFKKKKKSIVFKSFILFQTCAPFSFKNSYSFGYAVMGI